MPGVHVRTIKEADWQQQKSASVLTVPGSYWLCYKKNIYKFIFKYHRLHRSTERFTYEKELITVIRTVIKSNPCQGQHFVTRNLLVTCNHTAWTRKDKLYAMLKFKDRPDASTFSHEFVLTVTLTTPPRKKPLDTLESTNNQAERSELDTSEYSVLDDRQIHSIGQACSSNSGSEDLLSEVRQTKTNLDQTVDVNSSANDHADTSCSESTKIFDPPKDTNPRFSTQMQGTSQTGYATRSRGENSCVENNKGLLLPDYQVIKENVQRNALESTSYSENGVCSSQASFPCSKNIDESETAFNMTEPASEKNPDCYEETVQSSENTEDNSTSASDDCINDTMNLPYQYIIEKDIQQTKSDNALISSNNLRCTSKVEDSPDRQRLDVNKPNKEKSANEVVAKSLPNSMKSRSSDITDLVMEGLMFTIREDKDSVAVIEQKTKFEVDEVLENSEKAETKAGEKCLKNSSLLGLENLITMIEEPEHSNERYSNYTIRKECAPSHFDSFHSDSLYGSANNKLPHGPFAWKNHSRNSPEPSTSFACDSNDFPNTYSHSEMVDQIKCEAFPKKHTNMNMDCSEDEGQNDDEEEIEDEEEDIIPEALLMNTINPDESSAQYLLSHHKSNLPRVVSNELITVDQIPLAIQIALKNKLAKQYLTSATTINEINETKSQNDQCPIPSHQDQRESRLIEEDLDDVHDLPKIQLLKKSQNENAEEDKSDKSSVKSQKQKSDDDKSISRYNTRKKELELQRVSIQELKRLAPKGLQDITQDFYRDVLQMQKRSYLSEQRCLRQRKRSIEKDGEIRVEMLKFVRDITLGAKVVIKRMSTKTISNILRKNSRINCEHMSVL